VTEIIKELLPIFYHPVSIIFGRSFGSHFEKIFMTAKRIVQVAQTTKNAEFTQRVAAYEGILEQLQVDIYSFIHSIAKDDTSGHLEQTLEWYVNLLKFLHYREALDVQKLLIPFDEKERMTIIEEVNSVLQYNQIEEGSKLLSFTKPKPTHIKKLTPSFLEMMRKRLVYKPPGTMEPMA